MKNSESKKNIQSREDLSCNLLGDFIEFRPRCAVQLNNGSGWYEWITSNKHRLLVTSTKDGSIHFPKFLSGDEIIKSEYPDLVAAFLISIERKKLGFSLESVEKLITKKFGVINSNSEFKLIEDFLAGDHIDIKLDGLGYIKAEDIWDYCFCIISLVSPVFDDLKGKPKHLSSNPDDIIRKHTFTNNISTLEKTRRYLVEFLGDDVELPDDIVKAIAINNERLNRLFTKKSCDGICCKKE